MARPLVLIHGYSAEGTAFDSLRNALQKKGIKPTDINVCNYVSLNNEITIKDIAEGLDRAFRKHQVLLNEDQEFDAIVHSTGMLVLRSWLTNYGAAVGANRRLARLKHLIGLAPATWGSPQAHKGRTWLGALVKGNRQLGPDFLNAGIGFLKVWNWVAPSPGNWRMRTYWEKNLTTTKGAQHPSLRCSSAIILTMGYPAWRTIPGRTERCVGPDAA